ncbi:MAG: AAA family ATPase [Pseudomonadota bacterium]|nr:AAA family ATPase [Pseudomonadota bacterium]
MLQTLRLKNFTAFASADLSFCLGLNVIVGQNGAGKTHLLKAAYLLNRAWPDLMFKRSALNRKHAETYFEERLLGLFQPTRLENLIRRGSRGGCEIGGEVEAFIPTISARVGRMSRRLLAGVIRRMPNIRRKAR